MGVVVADDMIFPLLGGPQDDGYEPPMNTHWHERVQYGRGYRTVFVWSVQENFWDLLAVSVLGAYLWRSHTHKRDGCRFMIDSLAKLLIGAGLEPDTFTAAGGDEGIFRGEVRAGKVFETWANLAKGARETKYWPIIRGVSGESFEQIERDPVEILAAAPVGPIHEILRPRADERRESLRAMMPQLGGAADMYQLAAMADAAGINEFGGSDEEGEEWPTEPAHQGRVKLHSLKGRKGQASTVVLVRIEHTYEVPAYLGFGGWNDCPAPEVQVAVLREWQMEYRAVPVCMTGDVLEFVVNGRPQTEAAAMKLAAEQWIFCEDIVSQGTQSVRKLGMSIWQAPTWFFWWD